LEGPQFFRITPNSRKFHTTMENRRAVDLVQVDAFTTHAFGGNPAAVCLLRGSDWPTDGWLQSFAAEMNLSETAFLLPVVGDGNAAVHYALRWMTPTVEVDLCGHATLGAAHALYDTGRVADDQPILFHTRNAGLLTVTKHQGWVG